MEGLKAYNCVDYSYWEVCANWHSELVWHLYFLVEYRDSQAYHML